MNPYDPTGQLFRWQEPATVDPDWITEARDYIEGVEAAHAQAKAAGCGVAIVRDRYRAMAYANQFVPAGHTIDIDCDTGDAA